MVDRAGSTQLNTFAIHGHTLDIVVENQGRINFGAQINDNKKVCYFTVSFNHNIGRTRQQLSVRYHSFFDS